MRFYKHSHAFYGGVDLHARSMFTHILDHDGKIVFERDLPASPERFATPSHLIAGLVVGCECMFSWYWLADLCEDDEIPFTLSHALYRKAIHGGKSKNDRIDRQARKRGKKKALSVLEAKLGRAVYHVWSKQQAFDLRRFFA